MALTKQQIEQRENKLTASRVACLMSGDEAEIYNLWLEMTGDPSFTVPNFDDNWHVALGNCTEQLNLDWFEKKHGPVSGRGTVVVHPDEPWAAATLDGWSDNHSCPVECKHLIGFTKTPEAAVKYMPQMAWQMWITGADVCAFSPIQGAREPEVVFINRDLGYEEELKARAVKFMAHVINLTPPVKLPGFDAKVQVEAVKEYDIGELPKSDKNRAMWEKASSIWRDNRKRAKLFEDSAKVLKQLVPEDAARAHGYGIEITRNKAGSLSIKEL